MNAARQQAEALNSSAAWPPLPLAEWIDTRDGLHLRAQIVGKIRLGLTPPTNHWWHSTLEVTPTGLSTSAIPWGEGAFEIRFDLIAQRLVIETSAGRTEVIPLRAGSVADFRAALFERLDALGISPSIHDVPDELADRTPFSSDVRERPYDADAVRRFHRVLLGAQRVLQEFRGRFWGKASPAQFFWGSFDLAATRFSGRLAPPREGADRITRVAYSHECSSAGFWTGGGVYPDAAFYAYSAPEPPGLAAAAIAPPDAFYDTKAHEFLLPYQAVRTSRAPRELLLRFFQSTYEAGATLAGWDRHALELPVQRPGVGGGDAVSPG